MDEDEGSLTVHEEGGVEPGWDKEDIQLLCSIIILMKMIVIH